jgi:hypothetical protein
MPEVRSVSRLEFVARAVAASRFNLAIWLFASAPLPLWLHLGPFAGR